jgi:hypothetical protein
MKRWAWLLAIPVLISMAGAQVSASLNSPQNSAPASSSQGSGHDADSGERMFFPHDMLWGWAQLDLAPPHNEIDPNLCSGDVAANGGLQDPCSLFARYMLSGILEVRPFGRGPLRRFMVYGAPTFLFGKTLPKTLYTWSPDAIGIEHSWARDKNLGSADLGNNGPWGRYVTLGVRKTFGTRRW